MRVHKGGRVSQRGVAAVWVRARAIGLARLRAGRSVGTPLTRTVSRSLCCRTATVAFDPPRLARRTVSCAAVLARRRRRRRTRVRPRYAATRRLTTAFERAGQPTASAPASVGVAVVPVGAPDARVVGVARARSPRLASSFSTVAARFSIGASLVTVKTQPVSYKPADRLARRFVVARPAYNRLATAAGTARATATVVRRRAQPRSRTASALVVLR